MFYELTHIDDQPLSVSLTATDGEVRVMSGGIVLEPPAPDEVGGDGYSMFQLFGFQARLSAVAMIMASAEPYRWTALDLIEVARPAHWKPSTRMTGQRAGATLTLETQTTVKPLTAGTRLLFREAPDAPITAEWEPVTGYHGSPGPAFMEIIEEHRRARIERWRAAWRATA